jgi:hypothetical protein
MNRSVGHWMCKDSKTILHLLQVIQLLRLEWLPTQDLLLQSIALEKEWAMKLKELGIEHSEGVTMRNFLGVPVKIQGWNIAGLPKDDTST